MSFTPKVPNLKMPTAPKISTKGLTMPNKSLKVGINVKPQHVPKINWGKTNKISQKSSQQL